MSPPNADEPLQSTQPAPPRKPEVPHETLTIDTPLAPVSGEAPLSPADQGCGVTRAILDQSC
jgi:hypothetical protein